MDNLWIAFLIVGVIFILISIIGYFGWGGALWEVFFALIGVIMIVMAVIMWWSNRTEVIIVKEPVVSRLPPLPQAPSYGDIPPLYQTPSARRSSVRFNDSDDLYPQAKISSRYDLPPSHYSQRNPGSGPYGYVPTRSQYS